MKIINVLIADDHDVIRKGIRATVQLLEGWSVCGEASNGREAVDMALRMLPDIVVMDFQMPELNGSEATRQIKKRAPEIEVLMFTGLETEELVRQVFQAGARSFISKTDGQAPLVAALRALAEHKPYFTTKVAGLLFDEFLLSHQKEQDSITDLLTSREREVIQLLAEGSSNKEVAEKLGISVKTVETHRSTIMRKMHFQSFSDLVRYAVRNRLVAA
jgi:DNA-binding NarL/FixJ family response regulator